MSAQWSGAACPKASISSIRKPAVPGATVCPPTATFFGKRKTTACTPSSSTRSPAPRKKTAQKCRQKEICNHFGEVTKWDRCEVCDICAGTPKWLAGINQNASRKSLPVQNPNRALEASEYELNPTVRVNEELRELLPGRPRHPAPQKM